MKGFKNKTELEEWAYDQFRKYGIKHPDTYDEQELIDLNPAVPAGWIKQHATNKSKKP